MLNKQTIGIYCRISREKARRDRSIEDQKELGITFAKSKGYDFDVYIDENYSGTTDKRPEYRRLYSDITNGKLQIVWVYDESRLQRSQNIRLDLYSRLKNQGIRLITHSSGEIDLFNAHSQLNSGIQAEMNQYFVMITSEKIQSVLKRRVSSGKGWGIPPYGYRYNEEGYYKIVPEEAKIVKLIFKWSLSGIGTDKIAQRLNLMKVPTRFNGYKGQVRLHKKSFQREEKVISRKDFKWAGNTIRGIIGNSMFYGVKTIKDESFTVESLFSYDYWQKVNYNLKVVNRNTKTKGGGKKYQYLLNGRIRCGRCGSNYNGKTRKNQKDHFYYCMSKRRGNNCGNRSINIDKIESFIWKCLFSTTFLSNSILEYTESNSDYLTLHSKRKECLAKLEEISVQMGRIIDSIKEGYVKPHETEEVMNSLRADLNKSDDTLKRIEGHLKSLDVHPNMINEIHQKMNFSFEEKVDIVWKFIDQIHVHWNELPDKDTTYRFYILEIHYSIGNLKQLFTSGFKSNLDQWFSIDIDNATSKCQIGHEFWTSVPPNSSHLDLNFKSEQDFQAICKPMYCDAHSSSFKKASNEIKRELALRLEQAQKITEGWCLNG